MNDPDNQNVVQSLQERLHELERENKLLKESVAQGDRIQKMWQESVNELKQTKKALQLSEERFQLAMEGSDEGIWDWDLINRQAYYSTRWKTMLGYSEEEIENDIDTIRDLIHPDDVHEFDSAKDAYLNKKVEHYEVVVRIRTRAGDYRSIFFSGKAIWDKSGTPVRFVGISVDLTKRMEVEQQIKLGAKVFEATSEGVMITNKDMEIVSVNPAFTQLTGYSLSEVLGKNPRILSSGRHPPEFFKEMWRTINEKGHWDGEVWNRRSDGELYAEALRMNEIRNGLGEVTHYIGILSDITEQKKREEGLQHMAFHDALTGLPNRHVFIDRLGQALRHAKRNKEKVAVLFFDLDKFKAVNDTYGHGVGDILLKQVTERVLTQMREEDTLARIGGDEFCTILLGNLDEKRLAKIAQQIIDSLNEPFEIEGNLCEIGCSIGISIYPLDSSDLNQLVKCADEAMYEAKEGGRNRYVFHHSV